MIFEEFLKVNVIKINSSDAQMPCTTQIARHRWAVVDLFAKDQSAIFFQSNSLTDVTAVVAAAQKIHLLVANTIITGLQI